MDRLSLHQWLEAGNSLSMGVTVFLIYIFIDQLLVLQYVPITQPRISYSNEVCHFLFQPLEEHYKVSQGTVTYGLLLQPASPHQALSRQAYCDADCAYDPDDRGSTFGSCIYLGPNLISWWAKKQQLVARSSIEAEYRTIANIAAELIWIQILLKELKVAAFTPIILNRLTALLYIVSSSEVLSTTSSFAPSLSMHL